MIAGQIDKTLIPIHDSKLNEILALKRRLGYPDARMTPPFAASDSSTGASAQEVDGRFRDVSGKMECRS